MTADELITRVKELPMVSETARKLAIQLNQPDLPRDQLIKTLRSDNVLTAKLLRVCNSASCAVREPVVSIDQALLLLGSDAIFRMVSAIGFGDSLGLSAPGYDTEANGLWNHSLNTAVAAEYLAKVAAYGDAPPSTAFTAGLLHDIGKTVINKVLTPKDRAEIRNRAVQESLSRIAAEKAVLGVDHCEVGACLLQRWSLPEPIIEAVANHHSPVTKPLVKLSAVVYMANCAVHLSGTVPGWDAHVAEVRNTAAAMLGLELKKVEEFVAGIHSAVQTLPLFEAAA